MKASEIKVGCRYFANIKGIRVMVRVDGIRDFDRVTYDVTNLRTHRKTTFHSSNRFIEAVPNRPMFPPPDTFLRG